MTAGSAGLFRPEMRHSWDNWLERLYDLKRDKTGTHERPHKPVLLLAIMDLLDRGLMKENQVPLSDELVAAFKRYFEVVRKYNDQPTIQNPFFHMSGDRFWTLVPRSGVEPVYRPGAVRAPPSVRALQERVSHGRFDERLWRLLAEDVSRHQLREALIARYFPDHREQLASLAARGDPAEEVLREVPPHRRDRAFRHTVLEIYDYRCAACGIRVLLEHRISLVEAAHLIPFEVSRNDNPSNGMALCRNHHWAMDRHLIAPCPSRRSGAGIWQVSPRLDGRIEGQRELLALADKTVIAPADKKFFPSEEGLRWREQQLALIQ